MVVTVTTMYLLGRCTCSEKQKVICAPCAELIPCWYAGSECGIPCCSHPLTYKQSTAEIRVMNLRSQLEMEQALLQKKKKYVDVIKSKLAKVIHNCATFVTAEDEEEAMKTGF